jgi:hypothetical protein
MNYSTQTTHVDLDVRADRLEISAGRWDREGRSLRGLLSVCLGPRGLEIGWRPLQRRCHKELRTADDLRQALDELERLRRHLRRELAREGAR